MDAVPKKYSPDDALRLFLDNLRQTSPDAEVVKVIEELEAEAAPPRSRAPKSKGRKRHRDAKKKPELA